VLVPNPIVYAGHGQTFQISDLVSATDQDGDPIVYSFVDSTFGSGYFLVNGTEQPVNTIFNVTAAELAQITFVPAVGGSDDLMVRASDGQVFSEWSNLHIEGANNHAPEVQLTNQVVDAGPGQILQMTDLISASDQDHDAISYYLYDTTPGGGHFVLNGVEQANQMFSVTAEQLEQTSFVAAIGGSDDLLLLATDGYAFSGWWNMHIDGSAHLATSGSTDLHIV
jgi:hypothetical protein